MTPEEQKERLAFHEKINWALDDTSICVKCTLDADSPIYWPCDVEIARIYWASYWQEVYEDRMKH